MADELKNLHTATLRAEVAKLSEMFQLDESETGKLHLATPANRAVEKTRDTLRVAVTKNTGYLLSRSDIDMSAFTINDRHIRVAPAPKVLDSIKKTKVHNGSYIDADTGLWVNTQISAEVERRAARISISVGFYGSHVNYVGPTDSDVQDDESWKQTILAILTKEQLGEYVEHSKTRFKSTLIDMLLTALQFDLDLQDSQLPVIRRRLEERINPNPTNTSRMETTVGGILQRVKAEDFADILTEPQVTLWRLTQGE